jgi:hypothetical protein
MAVLRFSYPKPEEIRTFRAYKQLEGAAELELYEVSSLTVHFSGTHLDKFYHSVYGPSSGVTTFQRKNLTTNVWEPAGEISWTSNSNATVHFGIDEVEKKSARKFLLI